MNVRRGRKAKLLRQAVAYNNRLRMFRSLDRWADYDELQRIRRAIEREHGPTTLEFGPSSSLVDLPPSAIPQPKHTRQEELDADAEEQAAYERACRHFFTALNAHYLQDTDS